MIYSTKTSPALEKWECQDGVKNENPLKTASNRVPVFKTRKIPAKDNIQIEVL